MAERKAAERPQILGSGFLLSQLGAHAAGRFSEVLAPLGLTPPQVGLLRAIGDNPGRSQQTLAGEFHLPPSRMVGFIDDLEAAGLVERRRDHHDRRVHLLHLREAGETMLRKVAMIGQVAERELFAALDPAEQKVLSDLLTRIVDQQGLRRGVHPGYGKVATGQPHDSGPCAMPPGQTD